jgi:hypothetical protein
VRAALISLAGPPQQDAANGPPVVAGRSLPLRQLDFAMAAGCTRIVALGDGASPEAIALRHAAERAGARFQAIRHGRELLGVVRANDELVVMAPGLLPQAPEALAELTRGPALLVLEADAGVAAGFERIDLTRAWAGALAVAGGLVERLVELPPDSDPAAALLRIACQAHVSERRLPASLLAEGTWTFVGGEASLRTLDQAWVERNLPDAATFSPTRRVARTALRWLGARLLGAGRAGAAVQGLALALLAAAVALCAWGSAPAGFAVLALGSIVAAVSAGLERLGRAPFHASAPRWSWRAWQPLAVDLALTAACAFAVEGEWHRRLFPALVLILALRATRIEAGAGARALLGDRTLLALLFCGAAALGGVEPAIMLAGLAILALDAAKTAAQSG